MVCGWCTPPTRVALTAGLGQGPSSTLISEKKCDRAGELQVELIGSRIALKATPGPKLAFDGAPGE
jgi:hypothetical protein